MGNVKAIAAQVRGGQRALDVGTAKDLIRAAVKDGTVDAAEELAPMRDLFQARGTAVGHQLLEAFVDVAGRRPGSGGAGGLEREAIAKVVAQASEDALLPLLRRYQGTMENGPTRYTHQHVANYDIETRRLAVEESLSRYLEKGDLHRGLVGLLSPRRAERLENDPLRNVREYLATHYPAR